MLYCYTTDIASGFLLKIMYITMLCTGALKSHQIFKMASVDGKVLGDKRQLSTYIYLMQAEVMGTWK